MGGKKGKKGSGERHGESLLEQRAATSSDAKRNACTWREREARRAEKRKVEKKKRRYVITRRSDDNVEDKASLELTKAPVVAIRHRVSAIARLAIAFARFAVSRRQPRRPIKIAPRKIADREDPRVFFVSPAKRRRISRDRRKSIARSPTHACNRIAPVHRLAQ